MKQRLRHLLNRSSIYLAGRYPNDFTIGLMCRLNAMPFRFEQHEPLDMLS